MGLKVFWIDFKNIVKEKTFRNDVDFVDFQNNFLVENYYSFNDLFTIQENNKVDIESLNDDFLYAEIGNVSKVGEVEPIKLNISERKEEEENYYKKIEKGDIIQVEEKDILLSKVRPNLKKYVLVDKENAKYFFTSAFIHLRPKKLNKILYYSLRTIFYDNLIAISRQGKGYPTIKEDDFLYLKFDRSIIDKFIRKQDQIVAQIEPIEKNIKDLKSQITPAQEIINKVFAKEFGFDLEKFEELKKEKFFEVDFYKISKNNLLRISSHFHHLKLSIVENKLRDKDFWIPLSNKFKLSGGKRIPKGKTFSSEPTDYYYLRPSETNIWGIDKNNILYISNEIYNQLKKYRIKTGEFCISIVGTLGKTALINTVELAIENDNLILSENFIKLKPIQEINNLFYYYFFYSFIFETQMDREYTITSIKKLGIDKWSYIKIPNISLSEQQKIVDEIKAELEKQEEIKIKIENERNKIDEIIENSIKNN